MNVMNRLFAIGLLLGAIVFVTFLAAAPAEALGLAAGLTAGLQSVAARLLPAGRLLVALAGLAVNLALLFWLWLELRRPGRRTVHVRQADAAAAEVTTQTLTERLVYAVDALPGVVTASARVRSFGRSVEVAIEAELAPGVQLAHKADEIAVAVREMTETSMGLELRGKPRVRIKAIRQPSPGQSPAPGQSSAPAPVEPERRLPAPSDHSADEAEAATVEPSR